MKSAKTKKRNTAKTKQAAAPVTHTPKKSRSMVENLHEILASYSVLMNKYATSKYSPNTAISTSKRTKASSP